MIRCKQNRPGYYSALRQNRKILNKRLRKLDLEIFELTGERKKYQNSTESINSIIGDIKNANLWKRLKYFITGNVKTLAH